ncbi:hypothetical protein Q0M94_00475 [Deinococcus radiomollis]|uniref:hypothetical protein n=1 Tax=Deinococcus radiomollis TaxID=468916 RepID=UPI0038918D9B
MTSALSLPLLFAMIGGGWAYLYRPERRSALLLTLVLFQLLGAWGYRQEPSMELLLLLAPLALSVFAMLLHSLLHVKDTKSKS